MSPSQRPALGRGLSALIPTTGADDGGGGIETVDIDLIAPNPEQPRIHFDQVALEELAASIREHGVLQPVIVTRVKSDMGPDTYQLIAGERRVQAARLAGLARIPVLVKEATGAALLELALIENLQRHDLNPIEEAQAFKRLHGEYGMTQERIAERVGRGRAAVANTMRLLTLEEDIRASLASGQISEGHARALLQIDDARLRLDAWRKIVSDGLTVREAEDIARALRAGVATSSPRGAYRTGGSAPADPHIRDVEGRLRSALGVRVSVSKSRAGGRIVLRCTSDDELDALIERLSGTP